LSDQVSYPQKIGPDFYHYVNPQASYKFLSLTSLLSLLNTLCPQHNLSAFLGVQSQNLRLQKITEKVIFENILVEIISASDRTSNFLIERQQGCLFLVSS
jgi:hypothetical protein